MSVLRLLYLIPSLPIIRFRKNPELNFDMVHESSTRVDKHDIRLTVLT